MSAPSLENATLTSKWDGLSPHLIAGFWPIKKDGNGVWQRSEPQTVLTPLTEASMEVSLSWQSPFEHSGPESRAPTLLAMLQSGALQPIIDAVFNRKGNVEDATGFFSEAQRKSNEFVRQFEGRTGITKLNSTQVFNGMPPVKFQVTALFRAWDDPAKEVEEPFSKLMEWALPVELSPDGSVLARSAQSVRGELGFIDALVPSVAPTVIAMKYKNRIYSPLVIESISKPLASPVDASGRYVELSVPMTLGTLTAIDRDDWQGYRVSI